MDIGTVILVSVILLIFYWFRQPQSRARLPPGPPNLPLVGSLPFLGTDIREPLRKMAKKCCIHTRGSMEGTEAVHSHHTEGPGNGKSFLEPKILEELQSYLSVLEETDGAPVDPSHLTTQAVANLIFSIVEGRRKDYKEPEFIQYIADVEEACRVFGNSGILVALPFLRYLPGDIFGIEAIARKAVTGRQEMRDKIKQFRATNDPNNPRGLIDVYMNRADQEQEHNPDTTLRDEQLLQVVFDLFGAGTETTSSTIVWTMLHMLRNPDVMKRCQEEIDDVIGPHRAPSMKDKPSMPYVEATILEVQRMCDLVPFGLPHATTEDVEFGGYYIPKGTTIMPNLYALHYDPVTWPEPETFKPTRHLTTEGKLLKKDQLIPFCVGKRVCLGESIVRMQVFMFFTALLQRFHLVLPDGDDIPSYVGAVGNTNRPLPFRVIFKHRNEKRI